MKRTTTWVFGSPARPTLRPEHYWLRLVVACLRVSLQASPEHTGNLCASNRMIRNVSLGSAVATGAIFSLLCLSSPAVMAEKINKAPAVIPSVQKVLAERVTRCRFQAQSGPEMVIIAAVPFQQGSAANEPGHNTDEAPKHKVSIAKPFALGRCEVSVAEFRLFVQQTAYQTDAEKSGGCFSWYTGAKKFSQNADQNWRNPGYKQGEQHPVSCVSWNDIQAYIEWLNAYLGLAENTYRLPSESEWEYAMRAGTSSAYFWGAKSQCSYANGLDKAAKNSALFDANWSYAKCDDRFVYTAPVGSFKANRWGLYDMSGNVWEWTQDCWHDNYNDAPEDGRAWLEDDKSDCTRRSVRGGGWIYLPSYLRSAFRYRLSASEANLNLGFRLARTL